MTTSILLTGVGGQGIILMSKILALGLVNAGYDVKMSEIHGMSQRGGTVTTQIRYGPKVYSPGIGEGEADLIVSFEKMEALRALPFLKKNGKIFTDDREIYSAPVLAGTIPYPSGAIEALRSSGAEVIVVSAAKIAEALGNIRAQNVVLLGALVKVLRLPGLDWPKLVSENVPAHAIDINIKAFNAGYEA